MSIIGVDEHKWKHCRGQGDASFVTVIVDLTPVYRNDGKKSAPARLLDVVPGRSKQALAQWLKARDKQFVDKVDIVATDGFTGYKTATSQATP